MISVFLLSSLGVVISSCIHVAANGIIFLFYDWVKLNIQKTKIMASGPIPSWQIDGETVETVADFIFGAPKSLQMVIAAMKLKDVYSLEGKLWPI